MEPNIIYTYLLSLNVYKENDTYRLKVMNGYYDENFFSDIGFDTFQDLIKELQKEIDFYKDLNTDLL